MSNVLMDDLISGLSETFNEMFSSKADELNRCVLKIQTNEKGNYEVPIISADSKGITVNQSNAGAFKLEDGAKVRVDSIDNIPPRNIIVRQLLSYDDACKAYIDSNFRTVLFGKLFTLGVLNIRKARGWGYDVIQFGSTAFTFTRNGPIKGIFREVENGDIEIRFYSDTII